MCESVYGYTSVCFVWVGKRVAWAFSAVKTVIRCQFHQHVYEKLFQAQKDSDSDNLTVFIVLLGLSSVKAAHITLMKLTQGANLINNLAAFLKSA